MRLRRDVSSLREATVLRLFLLGHADVLHCETSQAEYNLFLCWSRTSNANQLLSISRYGFSWIQDASNLTARRSGTANMIDIFDKS